MFARFCDANKLRHDIYIYIYKYNEFFLRAAERWNIVRGEWLFLDLCIVFGGQEQAHVRSRTEHAGHVGVRGRLAIAGSSQVEVELPGDFQSDSIQLSAPCGVPPPPK